MKTTTIKINGINFTTIYVNELPTNYLISDDGQVWSSKKSRLLKVQTNNNGYRRVSLGIDGTIYQLYVHRLVLCHFGTEPCDDTMMVNHIDEDKTNNNINNLEWLTPSNNVKYARMNKAVTNTGFGIKCKLIMENETMEFESMNQAANFLGINRTSVYNFLKGFQKTIKGFTLELC